MSHVVHASGRLFLVSLLAAVSAQVLKFILYAFSRKKTRYERLVGAGGMPSSHAAIVTALVSGIGFEEGWRSPYFAIAGVFGIIVMYDAMSLRRTVGRQSRYLNLVSRTEGMSALEAQEFPEFVGHTPFEVIMGALWGMVLAFLLAR